MACSKIPSNCSRLNAPEFREGLDPVSIRRRPSCRECNHTSAAKAAEV